MARLPSGGVRVVAKSTWFCCEFSADVDAEEPPRWAETLRELAKEGAGARTLRPHFGWAEMTFAMAKKGDLHVSIRLQNAPDYLNEVRLFLNLRQDDLPAMADCFASLIG